MDIKLIIALSIEMEVGDLAKVTVAEWHTAYSVWAQITQTAWVSPYLGRRESIRVYKCKQLKNNRV